MRISANVVIIISKPGDSIFTYALWHFTFGIVFLIRVVLIEHLKLVLFWRISKALVLAFHFRISCWGILIEQLWLTDLIVELLFLS